MEYGDDSFPYIISTFQDLNYNMEINHLRRAGASVTFRH